MIDDPLAIMDDGTAPIEGVEMTGMWTRRGQGDRRRAAIALTSLTCGYQNIFMLPEHLLLSSTGSQP